MKKVISFSLFGHDPMYLQGAIKNAVLAREFYPGWVCRFYVSQEVPGSIIERLKKENAEVVRVKRRSLTDGMFWRFYPASEKDVSVLIVRDVDSRLNDREARAVEQWLKSDKIFHIMRDHPYHTTEILGGMWGVKADSFRDIVWKIRYWRLKRALRLKRSFNKKGMDQIFLAREIYPQIKDRAMIHSDLVKYEGEDVLPFPTPRKPGEFVGQVFFVDDSVSLKDVALLENARLQIIK